MVSEQVDKDNESRFNKLYITPPPLTIINLQISHYPIIYNI